MTLSGINHAPAFLLDASIYIFRYYFSLPDHWSSEEGYGTGAVYGFTRLLLNLVADQRPQLMAACFDESLTSCFRNRLYAGYKSSRALPDEALAFQLNACREVVGLLGIPGFASETYEADDLIGSLMAQLHRRREDIPVAVLTRDKDLGQLLTRPQDFLWDYGAVPAAGGDGRLYREHVQRRFGVWPEQLVDYLALVGDSVDDIPGVPGIGPRTASALLQFAPSLAEIYQRLDEVASLPLRGASQLPGKLRQYRAQVEVAQLLATIVTSISEPQIDQSLQRGLPRREAFVDFCRRMGFGGALLKRFDQLLETGAAC